MSSALSKCCSACCHRFVVVAEDAEVSRHRSPEPLGHIRGDEGRMDVAVCGGRRRSGSRRWRRRSRLASSCRRAIPGQRAARGSRLLRVRRIRDARHQCDRVARTGGRARSGRPVGPGSWRPARVLPARARRDSHGTRTASTAAAVDGNRHLCDRALAERAGLTRQLLTFGEPAGREGERGFQCASLPELSGLLERVGDPDRSHARRLALRRCPRP